MDNSIFMHIFTASDHTGYDKLGLGLRPIFLRFHVMPQVATLFDVCYEIQVPPVLESEVHID